MANKIKRKSIIGKFILDSISIGMYSDPLMLLREYIQNSTDAIDELSNNSKIARKNTKIEINIDGASRSISIKDNGRGIASNNAWSTLHNIGRSTKKVNVNRGFRGIGRLGGLAYCDQLKFITKAKGEKIYSISIWNCNKLRKCINEENNLDARCVIRKIVQFSQEKYRNSPDDHFFIVEMHNVKSSRNTLLNVPAIKAYISQVAPVPFNCSKFRYGRIVEKKLREKVASHATYNIYVNGKKVFKPYSNTVSVYRNMQEEIKSVNFIDLTYDSKYLGFGWVAELELLGIIHSSNFVDGIRLRSGNILVGNKNLLSGLFRERRFNNYLIGEVHIVSNQLILNSRRDDFEDNDHKEAFYSSFAREIGLPFSQKIRYASQNRSKQKNQIRQNNLLKIAKDIHKNGHMSKIQKQRVISELRLIKEKKLDNLDTKKIDLLIDKVSHSNHFLEQNYKRISKGVKSMLSLVFDIIFEKCTDKKEVADIVNTIIKKIT